MPRAAPTYNHVSEELSDTWRKAIRYYCRVYDIQYKGLADYLCISPAAVSRLVRKNNPEKLTHTQYIAVIWALYDLVKFKTKNANNDFVEHDIQKFTRSLDWLLIERRREVKKFMDNKYSQEKQAL